MATRPWPIAIRTNRPPVMETDMNATTQTSLLRRIVDQAMGLTLLAYGGAILVHVASLAGN